MVYETTMDKDGKWRMQRLKQRDGLPPSTWFPYILFD
jgi:hypothetical protein